MITEGWTVRGYLPLKPLNPLLALQLVCELIITNHFPQLHSMHTLRGLHSDFMNLYLRTRSLFGLLLQCPGVITAPVSLLLSLELCYSHRCCMCIQQFTPSQTSAQLLHTTSVHSLFCLHQPYSEILPGKKKPWDGKLQRKGRKRADVKEYFYLNKCLLWLKLSSICSETEK